MSTKKPFFILGSPRSGSKLTKNILMKDSSVVIYPELHFLRPKLVGQDVIRSIISNLAQVSQGNANIKNIRTNNLPGSFWRPQPDWNFEKALTPFFIANQLMSKKLSNKTFL